MVFHVAISEVQLLILTLSEEAVMEHRCKIATSPTARLLHGGGLEAKAPSLLKFKARTLAPQSLPLGVPETAITKDQHLYWALTKKV